MLRAQQPVRIESVSAVVIRKDGSREDLGVVARARPWWRRWFR